MIPLDSDALKKLQEAKAYILAEPRRFIMADVFDSTDELNCGTACCIAGALLLVHAPERAEDGKSLRWLTTVRDLLGIEGREWRNEYVTPPEMSLFFASEWPPEYARRYNFVADTVIRSEEYIMRIYGAATEEDMLSYGVGTRELVTAARISNAQVMAELIDEICEKGGLWWVDNVEKENEDG